MMTDVTNVQKCLSNGHPDLCANTLQTIFCHCGLFLDQSEMAMIFVYVTIFFGSGLKHHYEDCVSALYRSI